MAKGFKLIPSEIPETTGPYGSALFYANIVEEFVKSSESSVRVEVPGRKAGTIQAALRKALKGGNFKVAVLQRGEEVYLQKK